MNDRLAVLVLYFASNLLASGAFAFDKWQAEHSGERIRERTLLVLAFLGPFGAFAAMRICRHKTQKPKFYLVPAFLLLHLIIVSCLISIALQTGSAVQTMPL